MWEQTATRHDLQMSIKQARKVLGACGMRRPVGWVSVGLGHSACMVRAATIMMMTRDVTLPVVISSRENHP